MSTAAAPPQKAAPKHPPKFLIWVWTGLIVPVLYIIQLVVVVKKSSSTSFQVLQAPESWSKYTTGGSGCPVLYITVVVAVAVAVVVVDICLHYFLLFP